MIDLEKLRDQAVECIGSHRIKMILLPSEVIGLVDQIQSLEDTAQALKVELECSGCGARALPAHFPPCPQSPKV